MAVSRPTGCISRVGTGIWGARQSGEGIEAGTHRANASKSPSPSSRLVAGGASTVEGGICSSGCRLLGLVNPKAKANMP